MPSTSVNVKLAISRSARWPYYKTRVLGRGDAQPGELVVPLQLTIDDALLRRQTVQVNIEIPTPDAPTVTIE
jgi:hypothetical protein